MSTYSMRVKRQMEARPTRRPVHIQLLEIDGLLETPQACTFCASYGAKMFDRNPIIRHIIYLVCVYVIVYNNKVECRLIDVENPNGAFSHRNQSLYSRRFHKWQSIFIMSYLLNRSHKSSSEEGPTT